jgi:hypothetical protein
LRRLGVLPPLEFTLAVVVVEELRLWKAKLSLRELTNAEIEAVAGGIGPGGANAAVNAHHRHAAPQEFSTTASSASLSGTFSSSST